jgi:hypothetical protein
MRATSDTAAAVRTLIAALPDACLRDLCVRLALNHLTLTPPATSPVEPEVRRKRGRPRGRPRRTATNGRRRGTEAPAKAADSKLVARRQRYAAKRAAARREAKAAAKAGSNGEDVPVTPAMLWQHAERVEPQAPWKAVARELGVKDVHAQAA